jgi:hypothetical protein
MGIYQAKCLDQPVKYIGQTKHSTPDTKNTAQANRNTDSNSVYSNNKLNTGHKFGTIRDTMVIIRMYRKGKHLKQIRVSATCRESANIIYK